jgi:hypothetical protein
MDVTLNSTAFGITGNTSANLISTIGTTLSYSSNVFGSVATLTNIKTGNAYTQVPYTFVKETLNSKNISGSLSYNTTSNTITGTSTNFTRYFTTNSVIYIQANATLSSTGEYHVIKNVVNTTSMELYTSPSNNSTPSTFYKVCPETLKSNFAIYEDTLKISNVQISSYSQLDANVYAVPSIGNSSAQTTLAINSGKGYIDGEFVKLYLYSGIETPTILVGGTNYQNNEKILFYGGEPIQTAEGYIETDSNGSIISTTVLKFGSGYKSNPNLAIKTVNGNGAVLTTNLREFNTSYEITGRVVKTGLGREKGYWTTTRGFLDSDKYIQDSYYYQDYSYQLDVALTLDKYKNILYNTFHTAGTELFGKYILKSKESISFNDVYDEGAILKTVVDFNITADATLFNSISLTVDNNLITADMEYGINYNFTMDRDTIKVDSDIYTTDLTYIATIL